MPRTARLSILGLYKFNDTILDSIVPPDGLAPSDVRNAILMECAELECVYPNWEFMRRAVDMWARVRRPEWQRMADAFHAEYNAIHNFDRNEDWTETSAETGTVNVSGENATRPNTTATQSRAAFNASTLADVEQTTMTGADTSDFENTETRDLHRPTTHTGHLYGNIGVTRTQEMIADELDLRRRDICQIIVEEFKERFCILVY